MNYIYGRNPLLEWLKSGLPVERIYLAQDLSGGAVGEIEKAAAREKIPIKRLPRQELNRLAEADSHQGVAAQIVLPPYAEIDDVLAAAQKKSEPPLLALLDCIQDPHNLGAILRTADAAGIHGLIIPKDNAAQMTPVVYKTSAGAAAHVPLARVTNLARTIEELKEQGLWFIGADEEGSKTYSDIDLKGPVGIVLGSEGQGLRRLVREKCDFLVRIPMAGRVSSLNVSVAAGLLFYEARRQRGWG